MVFRCIIHRGALYRKCFSLDMKEATVTMLLTMNCSRLGGSKRRHFQHFQEEIGSEYDKLHGYTVHQTMLKRFYYQLMHIMLKNTELLILKLRSNMFRFT